MEAPPPSGRSVVSRNENLRLTFQPALSPVLEGQRFRFSFNVAPRR
jgi:hypothetical protein